MRVRTRFAPSPTGFMHIGNLRTALYAYLFAKSNHGDFILRIEDTDQARYVEGAVDVIKNTLKAAGITPDEGEGFGGKFAPYVQSQRKEIYKKYAEELIEKGFAYRDEGAIRQKMPKTGETSFRDEIHGVVTIKNEELEDQILLKSDGMPTYNFANVIDDHLMEVTHIIRGTEFITSTPKHVLLYQAFEWDLPTFIHLAPVMGKNPDGSTSKLSKRHGATSFDDLCKMGYLPEAIVNYVALLGWNPKTTNQEIFSMQELIENFSADGLSKSPAVFDYDKLDWMNSEYFKAMSLEDFSNRAEKFLQKKILDDKFEFLMSLLQTRISKFSEIESASKFLIALPEFDPSLFVNKKNKVTIENSREILPKAIESLEKVENWTNENLSENLAELIESLGVKKGLVFWIVRVAASGQSVTPGGVTEVLYLLGKDESISRLKKNLANLESA